MCGIFGIYDHKDAARLTYLGLYSLQHRGEESAGMAVSDGMHMRSFRGMGLTGNVFNGDNLGALPGHMAVGHVRYSTTGSSVLKNAQPFTVKYAGGSLAIAHNGNLVNTTALRDRLEGSGSIFQTSMDSEIIVHLIARSHRTRIEDRIAEALRRARGAYSLVFLTENKLVAARDPYGIRPLSLGRLGTSLST